MSYIRKEKSDPPKNQGFSFRLRAILKSSKILDFEDFDFQNTQNQQFSKMKTLRSPRISEKMTKKYVFLKKTVFFSFFPVFGAAFLRKT